MARHIAYAVQVLDSYKTDRGCVDCGYKRCAAALHFDHKDPQTKRSDLGWYETRSKLKNRARLLRYLAHVERYCEIRCANCHTERGMREEHYRVRREAQLLVATDVLF